jgi:hypothetical protein
VFILWVFLIFLFVQIFAVLEHLLFVQIFLAV